MCGSARQLQQHKQKSVQVVLHTHFLCGKNWSLNHPYQTIWAALFLDFQLWDLLCVQLSEYFTDHACNFSLVWVFSCLTLSSVMRAAILFWLVVNPSRKCLLHVKMFEKIFKLKYVCRALVLAAFLLVCFVSILCCVTILFSFITLCFSCLLSDVL